jgi:hypothetical protein
MPGVRLKRYRIQYALLIDQDCDFDDTDARYSFELICGECLRVLAGTKWGVPKEYLQTFMAEMREDPLPCCRPALDVLMEYIFVKPWGSEKGPNPPEVMPVMSDAETADFIRRVTKTEGS